MLPPIPGHIESSNAPAFSVIKSAPVTKNPIHVADIHQTATSLGINAD
jgi:hypothetical protein